MGVSRCDGFVRAAKRGVIEESEHASRLLHEWRRYFLGVGRHERRSLGAPRPAGSRPRPPAPAPPPPGGGGGGARGVFFVHNPPPPPPTKTERAPGVPLSP